MRYNGAYRNGSVSPMSTEASAQSDRNNKKTTVMGGKGHLREDISWLIKL